jgi:hypothetical protein
MCLWVEPAGGEQKSADVEQKMVTLIYPYPPILTLFKAAIPNKLIVSWRVFEKLPKKT